MTLMRRLRHRIYERAGGRCELSGVPLVGGPDGPWEAHHRRPKGMGGTSRPNTDTVGNLLALAPCVHNMAPDSVHMMPERSRRNGWLVSKHEDDPASVPVVLRDGRVVLLGEEGYIPLPVRRVPPPQFSF
jgi:5-methylcytosine-specific restriction protein A